MFIREDMFPSTHPNGNRVKRVAVMLCDVCGNEFSRNVNVKKWREAKRHRCSLECFGRDGETGGTAYQQRRNTCLERYGVPSVVTRFASESGRKAHSPELEEQRWEKIRAGWRDGAKSLRRGLSLVRSRAEIRCLDTLAESLGPYVSQKHVNGWFIDGFFPRSGLYVQFDGTYWHSRPERVKRDTLENEWFAEHGLKLVRITDQEWKRDPDGCLSRVHSAASVK